MNLNIPLTSVDGLRGICNYTLYQIEFLTKNLKRYESEKRKKDLHIMSVANSGDGKLIKEVYEEL